MMQRLKTFFMNLKKKFKKRTDEEESLDPFIYE